MGNLRSLLEHLAADARMVSDSDASIAEVADRRRHRAGMIAVAATVALLLAIVGVGWNARDTNPEPSKAPGRYQGVVLRGTSLVAVDPSGRERPLLDLAE